jgi:hypothetical protein
VIVESIAIIAIIKFNFESHPSAPTLHLPVSSLNRCGSYVYTCMSETGFIDTGTLRPAVYIIIIIISSSSSSSSSRADFFGHWLLFQFLYPIHRVDMSSWTGDQPVARPLATNIHTHTHTHRINTHRHLYLDSGSNTRPQCLSGRRQFMP